MIKAEWTPAPWSTNSDPNFDNGEPFIIWGAQGPGYGIVATVAPYGGRGNKADARLIAAAPRLAEALALILDCFDPETIDQRLAEQAAIEALKIAGAEVNYDD